MIVKLAYYYPGYHHDPILFERCGPDWTEWELVRAATPRYPGHAQPRVPSWGYEDESTPEVMARKLRTAGAYGLSALVFVGYWYRGRPVADRPFRTALSVVGGGGAAPCLMWANHTRYDYPEPGDAAPEPHLAVDYSRAECARMVEYWVAEYLSHPNYFRLPDGRPFVAIYSPQALVNATGGPGLLADVIALLRHGLRMRRMPEPHVHACEVRFVRNPDCLACGFDSCSDYLAVGYSENVHGKEPFLSVPSLHGRLTVDTPAAERLGLIQHGYETLAARVPIPYYPVVVVGRDCSPRWQPTDNPRRGHYSTRPILTEFGPEYFALSGAVARRFLTSMSDPRLLFFNAWNEWTEGAYLEPDTTHGYSLLEVVRDL